MKVQAYNNINNEINVPQKQQPFGAVFITDINTRLPKITLTESLPDNVYVQGNKLITKFCSLSAYKISQIVGEINATKKLMIIFNDCSRVAYNQLSKELEIKSQKLSKLVYKVLEDTHATFTKEFNTKTLKRIKQTVIDKDIVSIIDAEN